MKVNLTNIGPFGELNVDLPDQAIIYGPNGIGKTTLLRAIAAVYGALEEKLAKRLLKNEEKEGIVELPEDSRVFRVRKKGRGVRIDGEVGIYPQELVLVSSNYPGAYTRRTNEISEYLLVIDKALKEIDSFDRLIQLCLGHASVSEASPYRAVFQEYGIDIGTSAFVDSLDASLKESIETYRELKERIKRLKDLAEAYAVMKAQIDGVRRGKCIVCGSPMNRPDNFDTLLSRFEELESEYFGLKTVVDSRFERIVSIDFPDPEELKEAIDFTSKFDPQKLHQIQTKLKIFMEEWGSKAAEMVKLFFHEVLRRPSSEVEVGNFIKVDGLNDYMMSAGERTVLTLALFAFVRINDYKNPPLPILVDEIFDTLSAESASRLIRLLQELFNGIPMYIISHRPNSLNVDLPLVNLAEEF